MSVQSVKDFHVEYAKDDNKDPLKYRFILTLSSPLSNVKTMQQIVAKDVGGVDLFQPVGIYSLEIVVARTFDPDQVLAALQKAISEDLSGIIRPKLTIVGQ